MADTNPGQSMDDILASIRRIIAEEPPAPAMPDPEPEDDVLELGPGVSATPAIPFSASEIPPLAAAPVQLAAPAAAAVPATPLVAASVQEASRQAMAALSGVSIDPNAGDNTLDGLVRELLRPMLKDWLDANLPELVERVVTREIARIGVS